jgi:hypothetical protein
VVQPDCCETVCPACNSPAKLVVAAATAGIGGK